MINKVVKMENIGPKEYLENQNPLRNRLFAIMRKNVLTFANVSKAIGISEMTVIRFVREEKDVDMVPLFKIENYILKEESVRA